MVSCLIFSKDRAFQLDGLLRSIKRYAPRDFHFTVFYKVSNEEFQLGYDRLFDLYPFAIFRKETDEHDFGGFVRQWVYRNTAENRLICFLTDDSVFFRAFETPTPLLTPFSYRLGLNTNYCQPIGMPQRVPIDDGAPIIHWEWRGMGAGDFGYPFSLDGTVYTFTQIAPLFELPYPLGNPSQMEATFAGHVDKVFAPIHMYAYRHSVLTSIPYNRVTEAGTTNPIIGGSLHTADAFNVRFLKGERMALDRMNFTDVYSAHMEVPLVVQS